MPQIQQTPERTANLILNAIKTHHRQLGVSSLALVLKGSKSKRIVDRKLYESKFFGALFYHQTDVIENFIKQLQEKKLIRSVLVIGFPYALPMLELTEKGMNMVENNLDVPLEIKRTVKRIKINESILTTLYLFDKCKDVIEVAKRRNLVESTIWMHLINAVKLGAISVIDIVELEKIKLIFKTKNQLQKTKLKELKEALPENISYEEIRCVLAEDHRENDER